MGTNKNLKRSGPLDGLGAAELADLLESDGVKRVHALPLFRWLQTGRRSPFEAPLEAWLARRVDPAFTGSMTTGKVASADGWTQKFRLRFADGGEVEAVRMGFSGRLTACLSTQVGCAMGCVFCATGQMGFRRHLSAGEIVAQARHLSADLGGGGRLRNLVMMGMGEPLHNFDRTMKALDLLTDPNGLGIGASRVTISTVGHVEGIQRLAEVAKPYTLAVSLHGASDAERAELVPVNRRWPLAELLAACRHYSSRTGRRVLIAWTLIDGVNDRDGHAERLGALLKGMDVHVNLIPLNPTGDYQGGAPAPQRVTAFHRILRASGLPVTVRQRRGIDVAAGCGQLGRSPGGRGSSVTG